MRPSLISALLGTTFATSVLASRTRTLERWLGGGDVPPWGDKPCSETDPSLVPDTGETRYYDFRVARGTSAPDGVQVPVIVVNGQFPGPLIEANWGDWIEVTVHNEIYGPEEPTVLHWHGLNQPGTPWYDGVTGNSQCAIVPGSSLTYKFRADEFGSSWYHSHFSAQYSTGVVGPIVIHGPNDAEYDVEYAPILVQDWYHDSYEDILELVHSPPAPGSKGPFRPFSDSNLVGGAGYFDCTNVTDGTACSPVSYRAWEFEPGKTYRLSFVNTGASAFETISIDGHKLTVIANDFVPVQPYETDSITIGVAQRTDVIVTANAEPGSYWLRAINDPFCGDTNATDGRGIIYYTGFDPETPPTSQGAPPASNPTCANKDLTSAIPQFAIPVAEADTTLSLTVANVPDASGVFRWTINGVSYEGDSANALLFEAMKGQTEYAAASNVYCIENPGPVVLNITNTSKGGHPIHTHGHDFQVLADGVGTWDGTILNSQNPQRRDVHMLKAALVGETHLVLQYTQDSPGLWPIHCHNAWHLSGGMTIMALERGNELTTLTVPDEILQTCPAFQEWQAANPGLGYGGMRKRSMARRDEEPVQHLDKPHINGVWGWPQPGASEDKAKRDEAPVSSTELTSIPPATTRVSEAETKTKTATHPHGTGSARRPVDDGKGKGHVEENLVPEYRKRDEV